MTPAASWTRVKAGWSDGWKALSDRATRAYASAAEVDPTGTLERVKAFLEALAASRASLDRMARKLPASPADEVERALVARHRALERRYLELAAGFYSDARPASAGTEVGVAPVVLVVGGLAVGVVGIAWAIAAYAYADNLREQTALAERELDARIEAGRQGRMLQPTTLPPQPNPVDAAKSAAKGVGLLLVGGLVVTAGAVLLPALLKR